MAPKAQASRTLWLLRHAKTVTDPPPGGSDYDRVLAPRGRRDATALGRLFAGTGEGLGPALKGVPLRPRSRWCRRRPARRQQPSWCWRTWPSRPQLRFDEELYGADPRRCSPSCAPSADDVDAAMVVGHNPTAHALSQGLLSARDKKGLSLAGRRGFPTCALGVYRFRVDGWTDVAAGSAKLVALMAPPYGDA